MNILIITEFFPPLNNIASGRPLSWARHLSKENKVTVLTVDKMYKDGSLDYKDENKEYCLIEIKRPFSRLGLGFINKIGWILKAFYKVRKIEWDVVISTSNPWQVHLLAYLLKKKGRLWVADYRDLWSGNFHTSTASGVRYNIHKCLEQKIIKKSDVITTVSTPLAEELHKMFVDKPIEVLFNGFEKEIGSCNIMNKDERKKIIIIHTGTIYEGKRDPTLLFRAIHELISEDKISEDHIEVRFLGNRLGNLLKIIKNTNSEKFTVLPGFVSREESIAEQENADLLLLLESNNKETRGVLTGKLFEYLASGTPIMSIGPLSYFSSSILIQKTNTGVVCEESVETMKSVIMKIKSREYHYSPNLDEIKKYSRSEQAEKISKIINEFYK